MQTTNFRLALLGISLGMYAPLAAYADWGTINLQSPSEKTVAIQAGGVTKRAHYVIRGGYKAAGVGMRNRGAGKISIAGIPPKSKVLRAFLYWDVLGAGEAPSFSKGKFNGTAIQGALVGSGGNPCWQGVSANYAYRADVTNLVNGNGSYKLSAFASGDRSGAFPWAAAVTPPLAEGATLVVIYANAKAPFIDMVVVEGSDLFTGTYTLTVDGFLASDPLALAKVTFFGADGQSIGPSCTAIENTRFNGSLLSRSDWNGADYPNQLWDTHSYAVRPRVVPGSDSAAIRVTFPLGSCDCLIFNGAVLAVSAGDSDGDGLADAWERHGYDADGDGTIDVDLPAMGAKATHKDIFLEIDWMTAAGHSHIPKATAIRTLVSAFKNAPVPNPDGVDGINLHVDYGQGGLFDKGGALPEQTVLPGIISGDWSAFDAIKATRFDPAREPIFHYALFAHRIDDAGTSGMSRGIPESDLVVSLGAWTHQVGSVEEQTGTLMHLLGHNLGLRHGGGDDVNYKPNFLSIMNYFYQTRGLRKNAKDGVFDYSRFLLPALNETALNERQGLNGGPALEAYGTRYFCNGARVAEMANKAIDWNCNSDSTESKVAADINNDTVQTTLSGFLEWDNLQFRGGQIGTPAGLLLEQRLYPSEFTEELTVLEDSRIPPSPPATGKE
ncbi:MAG: hypothetical protein ACU837_04955 [Gammaproteobacteria bacterium]